MRREALSEDFLRSLGAGGPDREQCALVVCFRGNLAINGHERASPLPHAYFPSMDAPRELKSSNCSPIASTGGILPSFYFSPNVESVTNERKEEQKEDKNALQFACHAFRFGVRSAFASFDSIFASHRTFLAPSARTARSLAQVAACSPNDKTVE